MDREEMLDNLRYFWNRKEDIEAWAGFDRDAIAKEFPEVIKAWEDLKLAQKVMNAVMNGVE